MVAKAMMMIDTANTPIAMNSNGETSLMAVSLVTLPMRAPTKRGVRVAESELSEPPVWIS